MMFFLSPLGCNYLELLKQNYILQSLLHWKKTVPAVRYKLVYYLKPKEPSHLTLPSH